MTTLLACTFGRLRRRSSTSPPRPVMGRSGNFCCASLRTAVIARTRSTSSASLSGAPVALSQADSCSQEFLDRLTRQPGRPSDRPLVFVHLPSTNHFFDLHPMQLPIPHSSTLFLVADMVSNGTLGWPKAP